MADNIFGIDESSKFARALAASEGVSVVQERGDINPYSTTDGKIHIGSPSIYNHEEYMGSLHREIAKQQKDMQFFHAVDVEKNPLQHMAKSILQGQCVEHHNHGTYQGRDRILSEEYQRNLQKGGGISKVVKGLATQSQTAAAMMYIGNEMRNDWQGYQHCDMPPEIEEEVKRLEPILKEDWLSLETEEDLRDLLERVQHEPLPPQGGQGEGDDDGDADEDSEKSDGEGGSGEESGEDQGGEEGEGEDSDDGECGPEGDSEGDGDSDGSDEEGDGESDSDGGGAEGSPDSQGQPSDGSGDGEGTLPDDPTGASEPQDSGDDGHSGQGEQVKGSPDNGVGATDAYSSLKDIGIVKEPADPGERPETFDRAPYVPKENDLEEVDLTNETRVTGWSEEIKRNLGTFTLTKKVKKYLISQRQTGYEYGTKRGKVCAKNVYKLYGHTGSDPRIFKQKNATKIETDIAIFILGDCSGSMSGNRYTVSACCQISMSEVLQTLRIQHMMMQFSTGRMGRRHHVMKKFGERNVSRDTLLKRYGADKVQMGCNADGEAVTAAAQYLARREEREKLLIVLSDGSPAYGGNDERYLEDTVKSIEASKTMDIIGVGIQTHSVERYYKTSKVVNRLDELEKVLLSLLRDKVLKA